MPSFDIASKVNIHEVTNALDQANREITTRFDFKDSKAKFELNDDKISLRAQNTFQLQQMITILELKLAKRQIDIRCLTIDEPTESLHEAKQIATIKQGIDQALAKKIVKIIKDSGAKVQASIQGEQIRVTGKNRDDLQSTIAMLREQKLELPLQYENFRD
jgi:cyclic-di-GMP-binding protein